MVYWSDLGGWVVGRGSDEVMGPIGSWVDGHVSNGVEDGGFFFSTMRERERERENKK